MIFGNIGSGKSTVSHYIGEQLPAFSRLSIDDFRQKYGDGTMSAERLAKQMFIDAALPEADQIIEATGCGETAEWLSQKLLRTQERKVLILITTPLNICLERLTQRIWDVPYPAPPEKAFTLAQETDERIRGGEPARHWQGHANVELIMHDCTGPDHLESIWNKVKTTLNP